MLSFYRSWQRAERQKGGKGEKRLFGEKKGGRAEWRKGRKGKKV